MRSLFVFSALSLLLVGAGCTSTLPEPETDLLVTPSTATVTSCSTGMQSFSDASGFSFCYPQAFKASSTKNADGVSVVITDKDGKVAKELRVVPRPTGTPEAAVLSYAAQKAGVVCETIKTPYPSATAYSIVGYPAGSPENQDMESVEACRSSQLYKTALPSLPLESFFLDQEKTDRMVLVSGEQDAVFAEQTALFMGSIDLK